MDGGDGGGGDVAGGAKHEAQPPRLRCRLARKRLDCQDFIAQI